MINSKPQLIVVAFLFDYWLEPLKKCNFEIVKEIKSKINKDIFAYLILIVFTVVFAYFVFENIFDSIYYNLGSLLLFIFLILVILYFLYKIISFDFISLKGDLVIVKNFFSYTKSEFNIKEIEEYSEFDKSKKGSYIKLFFKKSIYRIDSRSEELYKEIKFRLNARKVLLNKERIKTSLFSMLILGFITFFFGVFLFYENSSSKHIKSDDLVEVIGKISNEIELSSISHRRGSDTYYVKIEFEYYKDIDFILPDGFLNSLAYDDFFNDIQKGKVIAIDILKQDFENKILKNKPLNIIEKGLYNDDVVIYNLSDEIYTYLNSKNTIEFSNSNRKSDMFYGFLLILVVFTLSGYFFYEAFKDYKYL